MKRIHSAMLIFAIFFLASCKQNNSQASLPDGFGLWIMNSNEIYLADGNHTLLAGPALRKIGISKYYIVAFCEKSNATVDYPATVGYVIVNRKTGVRQVLSEAQVRSALQAAGDSFPQMFEYSDFKNSANE